MHVDDLVVKSKKPKQHLSNLWEAFAVLQHYQMKLNLLKCTFGVELGKFLGFMISERGIEANPEKVKAIVGMPPTTFTKSIDSRSGGLKPLYCLVDRSMHSILQDSKEGSVMGYCL